MLTYVTFLADLPFYIRNEKFAKLNNLIPSYFLGLFL